MATLAKRKVKNGDSIYIQFFLNGERKTLTLGLKYTFKQAEEIKLYVEKVVRCIETGGEPDKRTALWLDSMADDLRERFTACGLFERAEAVTLGELWELFLAEHPGDGIKDTTLQTYETIQKRFFPFFDADADPESLTKAACLEWVDALRGKYAEASVAGSIQRSKTVFRWAVGKGIIRLNPFEGIKRGSMVNEKKRQYIPKEWYIKLLDACPDQTWRTLLALCRFGGLRNTSETLRLQWSDVNWEKGRLKVTSPKTEGHRGHETRVIPMFPEIREELERQFEQAEPGGCPFVVDRWRDTTTNLRTHFQRIIFRAGLTQWPDLFQNLRRSRDIELSSEYPAHVAAEWMGHSPQVAREHYLFATDADFERAANTPQKGENGPKNAETPPFGPRSTALHAPDGSRIADKKEPFEP